MKHTIYGISLAVITMLVVAIVLGISGRNVRKNEMETSLNTAVEQSLEQLRNEKGYEIGSYQELIADFNQVLLLQMESDSDIQVNILTADVEKGILDVEITETYRNILGKEEQAVCRKSVVLEEYSEKKVYHMVTFLVDGEVYARYSIYEGGKLVQPKKMPEKEGARFCYWVRQGENRECELEEIVADGEIFLEAVFESNCT